MVQGTGLSTLGSTRGLRMPPDTLFLTLRSALSHLLVENTQWKSEHTVLATLVVSLPMASAAILTSQQETDHVLYLDVTSTSTTA